MITVGAFDAKTHFSKLLADVSHGEEVVITKHGQKIAILSPYEKHTETIDPVTSAIDSLKHLRKGVTLGDDLTIRDLINEGRK